MPSYTPKRLTDKAKTWIVKALKDDYAQTGEPVIWDAMVAVFPEYSATESTQIGSSTDLSAVVPRPALVLYLEIPGLTPETPLYISPIVPPYDLDEEMVRVAVQKGLTSVRTYREAIKADLDKSVDPGE